MKTKNLILTSLFIALAIVLPFVTVQLPQLGKMLALMHFPVIIAGLYLGPISGLIVGFISPLLRMSLFGMPPLLMAICMSFELATYGLITAILKDKLNIYINLIITIIGGRVVYCLVAMIIINTTFLPTFITTFTTAAIGIILQLILIPQVIKRI